MAGIERESAKASLVAMARTLIFKEFIRSWQVNCQEYGAKKF
jgi:hypothetical protein